MTARHKVFVSYYHEEDQEYRDRFERLFAQRSDIMVPQSVDIGDIDPNLNTETIRRIIRDDYISDATVTVVLVGPHTWQRKHVDWEIYSSLRDTQHNPRCGLLGILLPSYSPLGNKYNPNTIPPRLHDNIECSYAGIYNWCTDPNLIAKRIHEAFKRRTQNPPPNLSRDMFQNNRFGNCWK